MWGKAPSPDGASEDKAPPRVHRRTRRSRIMIDAEGSVSVACHSGERKAPGRSHPHPPIGRVSDSSDRMNRMNRIAGPSGLSSVILIIPSEFRFCAVPRYAASGHSNCGSADTTGSSTLLRVPCFAGGVGLMSRRLNSRRQTRRRACSRPPRCRGLPAPVPSLRESTGPARRRRVRPRH